MAFLCPARIRRNKKKKSVATSGYASEGDEKVSRPPGMGRITGSASIETLVRVGLEKEQGLSPDSKMVVIQDFTPCVDDELEVKRGNVVNVLYQENDWVYVISEAGEQEGFIPHSYCAPVNHTPTSITANKPKKMPRDAALDGGSSNLETDHNTTLGTNSGGGPRRCDSLYDFDNPAMVNSDNDSYGCSNTTAGGGRLPPARSSDSSLVTPQQLTPDVHPFFKDPAGHYIVLYTFIARDENDVSVERGEFVTVLNREDPDWYWVLRSDGQEGFVPSGFVYPADVIQDHIQQGNATTDSSNVMSDPPGPGGGGGGGGGGSHHQSSAGYVSAAPHHLSPASNEELRFHGSELVMLYDYKAQAPDDLSVRRGDWIYADLSNQTVDGWLWAYTPKTRKSGFIPKAYARPPAMTSL